MTNEELKALLDANTAKLVDIDTAIKNLQAAIAASANVPQDVVDAANALAAQVATDAADAGV